MKLYDAHAHFAASELSPHWSQISHDLTQIGLQKAVVNGSSPADWPKVLQLAKSDSRLIPAIGLHPWYVNRAAADWQEHFLEAVANGGQVIGEIGLDKWIKGYDLERQQDAFRWQLAQASTHNLPVSIHCLQAIGTLIHILRSTSVPRRGIHLHAYNGPVELIPELVEIGAYFSFNAGQLQASRPKISASIRAVPADRLLIETDAPNMLAVLEGLRFELPKSAAGKPLTHPASLINGYTAIAAIRTTPLDPLVKQVANNFECYFLN